MKVANEKGKQIQEIARTIIGIGATYSDRRVGWQRLKYYRPWAFDAPTDEEIIVILKNELQQKGFGDVSVKMSDLFEQIVVGIDHKYYNNKQAIH